MNKFQVGQTLYVRQSNHRGISEFDTPITKVGRDYVYFVCGNKTLRASIDELGNIPKYGVKTDCEYNVSSVWLSERQYRTLNEVDSIRDLVTNFFNDSRYSPQKVTVLSIEKLRQIAEIAGIDLGEWK